jgi:hypothetical protein
MILSGYLDLVSFGLGHVLLSHSALWGYPLVIHQIERVQILWVLLGVFAGTLVGCYAFILLIKIISRSLPMRIPVRGVVRAVRFSVNFCC